MHNNAFFKLSDPEANEVAGFEIPKGWWSRKKEYFWALQHNLMGGVVADMGFGFTYRPFHDALCRHAGLVYGVDIKPPQWSEVEHPLPPNFEVIVADFTKDFAGIPAHSLDRIFCLSVLEDTNNPKGALQVFKKLLAPDGKIVLTFDVPYDKTKPTPKYPGVNWEQFMADVDDVGLHFVGAVDADMTDALYNEEYNLCVFRCLLEA